MKSGHLMNALLGIYIFIFFTYLFGPLLIMSVTALTLLSFPQLLLGNVLAGDGLMKAKLLTMDKSLLVLRLTGGFMMVLFQVSLLALVLSFCQYLLDLLHQ